MRRAFLCGGRYLSPIERSMHTILQGQKLLILFSPWKENCIEAGFPPAFFLFRKKFSDKRRGQVNYL